MYVPHIAITYVPDPYGCTITARYSDNPGTANRSPAAGEKLPAHNCRVMFSIDALTNCVFAACVLSVPTASVGTVTAPDADRFPFIVKFPVIVPPDVDNRDVSDGWT